MKRSVITALLFLKLAISCVLVFTAPHLMASITFGAWNEVPGSGVTKVSDSVVAFQNRLYLFGIGVDDHAHYVNVFDDSQWGGWKPVPGGGTTAVPDAATVYNGRMYLFGIGINDHAHYVNVFDGAMWSGWSLVPGGGSSKVSDAAIVYNGRIYLFGIGIDDRAHYVNTFDGFRWSGWAPLPGGGTTNASDAVTVYNGKVYLFAIGINDHAHYVNTFDGTQWSGWTLLPGGGTTNVADFAAVYNGKLYLFAIGINDHAHYVNAFDGNRWSGWKLQPGSLVTSVSDSAASLDGKIYQFSVGSDSHHYFRSAGEPQTPYNKVYGIATHNSYWLNRSDQVDYYSSGTQELLGDQLLHDHVRAIELDVHSEGAPAHEWKVYHTSDSEDFQCRFLSDCLEYIRNFHYAVPHHEVVNIIVELKNTLPYTGGGTPFPWIHTHFNFDADHTMQDFDAIFRRALGGAIYTPDDFLSGCPVQTTLRECGKRSGAWPTVEGLRGKFIINVIGNWSTAAYDFVQYAAKDVQNHVAFPMQSIFAVNSGRCPGTVAGSGGSASTSFTVTNFNGSTLCIRDIDDSFDPSPHIDPATRQSAFDASLFWQVEDTSSPPALNTSSTFLNVFNGVIRGHDSFEFKPDCDNDLDSGNCQENRIRAGFQLIQTDYPWHFVNDVAWNSLGLPIDASQRLKDLKSLPSLEGQSPDFSIFHEPGSRIYFQSGATYPGAWVYKTVPRSASRWLETTVSSTRHGDTWGEYTQLAGYVIPALEDYITTCPISPYPEAICTNYARIAQEDGEGCIKVASFEGANSVEVCRQKNTTPGASFYQESVDVYVRVYRNGQKIMEKEWVAGRYSPCKRSFDPNSNDVSDVCVGSLLAIAVQNKGTTSQVAVYSAGKLSSPDTSPQVPQWVQLDLESFNMPMEKEGVRGWKSELMVGNREADRLIEVGNSDWRPDMAHLRDVTLDDFPGREVDSSSRVVDMSY